jgi:hypothetical protein
MLRDDVLGGTSRGFVMDVGSGIKPCCDGERSALSFWLRLVSDEDDPHRNEDRTKNNQRALGPVQTLAAARELSGGRGQTTRTCLFNGVFRYFGMSAEVILCTFPSSLIA